MFGVDTVSYLNSINWSSFYSWKGIYPSFAGRYFGGGEGWSPGEGTDAKQSTGGKLALIMPIQASADDIPMHQEQTGATGYDYGQSDASATCANIVTVVNSGELVIPPSDQVNVYLDVEPGTQLSKDYWAGWATTVYSYALSSGLAPFSPVIYCQFILGPDGRYIPNTNIQDVLNNVCATYPPPTHQARCYGLWTSEPETPCLEYCSTDPCLDWTQFDAVSQPCGGTNYPVPLLAWQFAEKNGCDNCSGIVNYAGGQNLDMDDTDNSVGPSYMLQIS